METLTLDDPYTVSCHVSCHTRAYRASQSAFPLVRAGALGGVLFQDIGMGCLKTSE
jgi:hypothetical protein